MVERIGMASTMQSETVCAGQSVNSSENVKAREVTEKEPTAARTDESRKRDRFEYSGEAARAGSPDDPKAREAFDKVHNAAQANDSRSYDRLELSGEYPDLSAKTADGVKAGDSAAQDGSVKISADEETSTQSVSYDDSSEDVDTNKLYQYTATELKDFLLDGSITQSEYDAEIAKREG